MARNERTVDQIRADIAASRHAMTVGVEGLVSEVHPTTIKNRAVDDVKQAVDDTKNLVYDTIDDTRGYFIDKGGVRWNNVGTVALVVVGAVVAFGVVRGTTALIRRIGK